MPLARLSCEPERLAAWAHVAAERVQLIVAAGDELLRALPELRARARQSQPASSFVQ